MKKLSLVALAVLLSVSAISQNYTIDADASVVEWKGGKIVGNSHNGTLDFSEGSFTVKGDKITSGKFVVDMTTIVDADGTKKLEGHLKSDDFFSVEKYPTAELVVKSSKKGKAGEIQVTADLTIKGTTEEVTFGALLKEDGNGVMATAQLTFDRSKFDVRYGSGSFFDNLGDKAIKDDIELNVKLKASK